VVLRGEPDGFDASNHPHRAGPLNCTYIPLGYPHGARNSGMDDVVLIWVHARANSTNDPGVWRRHRPARARI
jgi:mannose-6-phosphate isomerase-like protein (cupin superfamily)